MSQQLDAPPPATELWRCGEQELRDRLVAVETRMRQLYGESLQIISECANRGETPFGYTRLTHFLHDLLYITTREAQQRIEHADALIGSHTTAGTALPAPLVETGTALLSGALSAKHVEQIHKTMAELPPTASDADRALAEHTLVEHAQMLDPGQLARAGRRIVAHLDPDGAPPADGEWQPPVNELRVQRKRSGRLALAGELDPVTGAMLTTYLAPLAKPRPTHDGLVDLRSRAERYGDAFAELIHLCGPATATELPQQGGEPPHLSVVISDDALRTGLGTAQLDGHLRAPTSQVRHLACHARILPMVLDTNSVPLDVGRAARTAPLPIRRALAIRDQGCAFPGCDRPPSMAQAHHIQEWEQMGETKLANMCSLCLFHHQLMHNSPWQVRIAPDGKPEFLPPAAVDPERKPRRNTKHTGAIPGG